MVNRVYHLIAASERLEEKLSRCGSGDRTDQRLDETVLLGHHPPARRRKLLWLTLKS